MVVGLLAVRGGAWPWVVVGGNGGDGGDGGEGWWVGGWVGGWLVVSGGSMGKLQR